MYHVLFEPSSFLVLVGLLNKHAALAAVVETRPAVAEGNFYQSFISKQIARVCLACP